MSDPMFPGIDILTSTGQLSGTPPAPNALPGQPDAYQVRARQELLAVINNHKYPIPPEARDKLQQLVKKLFRENALTPIHVDSILIRINDIIDAKGRAANGQLMSRGPKAETRDFKGLERFEIPPKTSKGAIS